MEQTQTRNAFEITTDEDFVVIKIHKGMIGSLSNQLRNTNNARKGASILRRLGFDLKKIGNDLYENE